MQLEKGRISASQLTFLIAGFMQGSLFVLIFTFANTARNNWLLILATYAIFIPFAFIYIKLSSMFPKSNLIQINEIVYGKVLGNAVSVLYCILFILLSTLNIRFPVGSLATVYMSGTPLMAFVLFYIIMCAWAVKNGIETIGRVSLFITVITLGTFAIYFIFLANKFKITHFFPILDMDPRKIIINFNGFFTIYMGEIFIFSMILPYVSDKANLKKQYMYGTLIGVLTIFTAAVMVTGVLGNYGAISSWPLVDASKIIEVQNINARIDFIFMGVIIIISFTKSAVLYYITVSSIANLFKLKSLKYLIAPIGILILGLTVPITENAITNMVSAKDSFTYVAYTMLFVIPIMTTVTAAIRRLPKKQEGEGS